MKELMYVASCYTTFFHPSNPTHFLRAIPSSRFLSPVDFLESSRAYGLLTKEHLSIDRATTLLNFPLSVVSFRWLICFLTAHPAPTVLATAALHDKDPETS